MRAPLSDGAADVPGGFDPATAAPIPPLPPDLRLAPAAAAAWLAAWVAVGAPAAALLAAAPAGCAGLVLLHRRRHLVVAAALLCAVTASGAGALRVFSLGQGPISELAQVGAAVTVELVVGSDPRRYPASTRGGPRRSDATLLRARIDRVSARGRTTPDPYACARHHLRSGRGRLGRPRPRASHPGERGPRPAAGRRLGGRRPHRPRPSRGDRGAGRCLLGGRDLAGRPARGRAGPAGRRARAAARPGRGGRLHLPPALAEDFRATGMTHLITVSGVNVGCTGGT